MDEDLYAGIMQQLQTAGFNTEKLLITPQPTF